MSSDIYVLTTFRKSARRLTRKLTVAIGRVQLARTRARLSNDREQTFNGITKRQAVCNRGVYTLRGGKTWP